MLDSQSAPFEVLNPDGTAPVLIACDHAGNHIPESLSGLELDACYLTRHIAWDIGARQVAARLAALFDAPCLLARYSRLVIDLNRHLHDPSLIAVASDGVEIPGNLNLTGQERSARIEKFFHPYHNQYREMVSLLKSRHQKPIILSVHSFTPRMNGKQRPWDFGVLWDEDEALARALIANLRKIPGRVTGENQPYHARHPRGYAQVVHARNRGVELALLEIRQDLIGDREGQAEIAGLIYAVLKPILSRH